MAIKEEVLMYIAERLRLGVSLEKALAEVKKSKLFDDKEVTFILEKLNSKSNTAGKGLSQILGIFQKLLNLDTKIAGEFLLWSSILWKRRKELDSRKKRILGALSLRASILNIAMAASLGIISVNLPVAAELILTQTMPIYSTLPFAIVASVIVVINSFLNYLFLFAKRPILHATLSLAVYWACYKIASVVFIGA